jgi:hypothetical protein
MTTLEKPGDTIEGSGVLLRQGRIVVRVDYHLAIPTQTHFLVNPTGQLDLDYSDHAAGFILVSLKDANNVLLADYALELEDKTRVFIKITHAYKQLNKDGQPKKAFWVKVAVQPH